MTTSAPLLFAVGMAFFGSLVASTMITIVAEVRRGRRSARARRERIKS